MESDLKIAKINKFLADELLVNTIFENIRNSFLSKKGLRDINIMAAERIAIELLDEALKDLYRYKSKEDRTPTQIKQVGL